MTESFGDSYLESLAAFKAEIVAKAQKGELDELTTELSATHHMLFLELTLQAKSEATTTKLDPTQILNEYTWQSLREQLLSYDSEIDQIEIFLSSVYFLVIIFGSALASGQIQTDQIASQTDELKAFAQQLQLSNTLHNLVLGNKGSNPAWDLLAG